MPTRFVNADVDDVVQQRVAFAQASDHYSSDVLAALAPTPGAGA
jgi:hypothetical protein